MCRLEFHELVLIFSVLLHYVQANAVTCPLNDASLLNGPCGEFESCFQVTKSSTDGICKCRPGYERSLTNASCVYVDAEPRSAAAESAIIIINDSTSTAAIVFVSLFAILSVLGAVVGVYYGEKRYRIVTRLRSHVVRQNASNYDEVMIGQDDDDPPIA